MSIFKHLNQVIFLTLIWNYIAHAACPKFHGETLKSRSAVDSNGWTALNTGNPITCDGYITAWRFFPTVSTRFVAIVMRPYIVAKDKYVVVGRTVIPKQQHVNQPREYKLQESDWISVKSGDVIGFNFDTALLPYDSGSGSAYMFASGIDQDQLITFTIHTFTGDGGNREYSFQAILKDSYLPCHIINWPLIKVADAQNSSVKNTIWMDDWNKVRCPGRITSWRFMPVGPAEIYGLVFRAVDSDNNVYKIIGKTVIPEQTDFDDIIEFPLSTSEQIDVLPGDKIGFAYTDNVLYYLNIFSNTNLESMYKYIEQNNNKTIELETEIKFSNKKRRKYLFEAVLSDPHTSQQSTTIVKNHKLQFNVTESKLASNLLSCVKSCLENQECKSVNYNEDTSNCELNQVSVNDHVGELVEEAGIKYVEMNQKITPNVGGNCAFVDCGLGNVCVDILNEKRRYLCMCLATGYLAINCPLAECLAPLGMESGDIVDNQITANSEYDQYHGPHCGRLMLEMCSAEAWCAHENTPNPWIKIDLLVEHKITGIQTQGRPTNGINQWVTTYSISYIKVKQLGETFISDGHGAPKTFDGNWNANSIRTHYFNPVIQAVAIKIYPNDYNGYRCLRAEVLGCRSGSEWVRVFKGVSMTGDSIYNAWQTGADTSSYYAHQFLISDKFYRNNVILDSWSSRNIQQVKLTLFSDFNKELLSIIFNGVDTTTSTWFSRDRVQSSPWDDIKTADSNFFSINGEDHTSRRFFISSYYNGCEGDTGWFAVIESNHCAEWEGYGTNPRIIYSKTNKAQSFFAGDFGTARAMTIDVLFGW